MKKRLIAMMLVLCMVLSIIPVSAEGGAAGALTLGATENVTLAAGEEVYYTFEAAGETRYYYYLKDLRPTDGTSDVGSIEIRPEGTNAGLHGTSYPYAGYEGTMAICDAADTVKIILINHGESSADLTLGVAQITEGTAASMSFETTALTMTIGDTYPLWTLFEPAFSFEEDVQFTTDNPIISFDYYIGGVEVVANGTGTANITATCGSMTAVCTVTVQEPQNALDITSTSQSVSVPANEQSVNYFQFTAPADAAGNHYVVHCAAQDDAQLKPVGFSTDNFQNANYELVLYDGNDLTPGGTYYVQLVCNGAFTGTMEVSFEKCSAPASFWLEGVNNIGVGDMTYINPVFTNPSEYMPVTWSVDNSDVLTLGNYGNYSAEFTGQQEGTATVTATIVGTSISADYVVTVGQTSQDPEGANDNVELDGNDGTFTISDGVDTLTSMGNLRLEIEAGNCLADYGLTVSDIFFWDTSRALTGWNVFYRTVVTDENGNSWTEDVLDESVGMLTTQQMLEYAIPADEYVIFRPLWEGDDSDYYFEVYFETVGGQMEVTDDGGANMHDGRGERVRKDSSATLADAIAWSITADPTHAENGAFEGWLEYREDNDGVMQLFSESTLTTSGIFTAAPLNQNVLYAAKWSNINIADYYDLFNDNAGENPGGTNVPMETFRITVLEEPVEVIGNSEGYAKIEFTPSETGLYMLSYLAYEDVIFEEISPAAVTNYAHDIFYYGDPFCGPVYELTAGQTYTITVFLGNGASPIMIVKGEAATDISASVTEVTGYVGTEVMLYYSVDPVGAFTGVSGAVPSDPTVAENTGGRNADCVQGVKLLKAGSTDVTITMANGKSVTIKVNAIDPPELTLGTPATADLDVQETATWMFTATQAGVYYFTADCATGECSFDFGDGEQFIGGFYSGTTSGVWLDLQAGENAFVTVTNPDNIAQTFTVKADIAPAATSISLDNWETYPTLNLWGICPAFEPLGAYDEVTSWTVSDPTVLEITDTYGNEANFTGLKPGTVTVTAKTAGGLTDTATYTVKEPMKLDTPETVELDANEFKQLVFQAPADGYYFTYMPTSENIDWGCSANDDNIWTEKYCGFWSTLQKDDYLILELWTTGDTPETTTVTVVDASKPITSMTLDPMPVVYMGTPCFIDIIPTPLGSMDLDQVIVADESILEFIGGGQYTIALEPKKTGTTTVTVTTQGGVSATCTVTVEEAAPIALDQGVAVDLQAGEYVGYQFTAPETGEYIINSTGIFIYEVSNSLMGAYFPDVQPVVELEKGDNALIMIYADDAASSGTVTISKRTADTTDITIPAISGVVGYSGQHIISQTPAGSFIGASEAWEVTDPSVAKIVAAGYNGVILEYLKAGTTTLKLHIIDAESGQIVKTFTSTITVTEPIVVPEDTSVPTTVTPEAVDEALKEAVQEAKPGETVEVVIKADEAAQEANTTVTTVELPVASLEAVADADAVLTVQLSEATVVLDTKTLETLVEKADGATITLSIARIETTQLTEKQQKALKNKKVSAVLTAQILSDGQYIGDFEGGSVTVSIPFTPPEGKNGNSYAIYYVSDDGMMEKMKTSFANDKLTFTTKHFSDYVLLEEEPGTTGGTGDGTGGTTGGDTAGGAGGSTGNGDEGPAVVPTTPSDPSETTPPTTPATTPTTPSASNPATGDSFMLIPVMVLFAVSALAILVLSKKRRV